jgi:hypothetical protein
VIRPFRFGDIVLIQRLGRQATKLNIVQSLLQPQSSLWTSLAAVVPWSILPWQDAKAQTYVLRHSGSGPTGGFLQTQKRPGRPELDLTHIAPSLDSSVGHPLIWEELLSQVVQEAARQQILRIFVDVPDEPLPVQIFNQAGFRVYTRQTIWRLPASGVDTLSLLPSTPLRAQAPIDDWGLRRLYSQITPPSVQLAEGMQLENGIKPPILEWRQAGSCSSFVLEEAGQINGAVQVVQGERGSWLQLWTEWRNPNAQVVHQLLQHGLSEIHRHAQHVPVYVGVRDYEGGLGALLSEYGFAPFTDRAKMVRHVAQRVREAIYTRSAAMEHAARAMQTAPFWPAQRRRRVLSRPAANQSLVLTGKWRWAPAVRTPLLLSAREWAS